VNRIRTSVGPVDRLGSWIIAASSLSALACGSSGPGMTQVSGRLTFQSKPVPKGLVSFVPATPEGRIATGQVDADGNYRLQTENPGDGALSGDYNVTISARDDVILDYIPKKPVPPKYLVPAKYENPKTSGLKATVKPGASPIDFDLKD